MKYELIIFDMDGTILNTLEDLKNSMNHALKTHNLPERSLEEIRNFVGNGIRTLIERAVPKNTSSEIMESVYETFLPYYKLHSSDFTRPYEHINDLLAELKNRGYKTAVVSNKAHAAVLDLCVQYFDGLFDLAIGERPEIAKKPAPDMVHLALQKMNVPKEKAVYIGDSDVDVATAKNSGLDMIAADWGFRDREILEAQGAEIIVSDPMEILELI